MLCYQFWPNTKLLSELYLPPNPSCFVYKDMCRIRSRFNPLDKPVFLDLTSNEAISIKPKRGRKLREKFDVKDILLLVDITANRRNNPSIISEIIYGDKLVALIENEELNVFLNYPAPIFRTELSSNGLIKKCSKRNANYFFCHLYLLNVKKSKWICLSSYSFNVIGTQQDPTYEPPHRFSTEYASIDCINRLRKTKVTSFSEGMMSSILLVNRELKLSFNIDELEYPLSPRCYSYEYLIEKFIEGGYSHDRTTWIEFIENYWSKSDDSILNSHYDKYHVDASLGMDIAYCKSFVIHLNKTVERRSKKDVATDTKNTTTDKIVYLNILRKMFEKS